MNNEKLVVIMPVYNEEALIEKSVNSLVNILENLNVDYKLLIYNDGSTDNTMAILHKIRGFNDKIEIIDKPNTGHGNTILTAYKENTDIDWIFQLDADNEIEAENFTKLWQNRANYDFLIGKRKYVKKMLSRKIVSAISRLTVSLLYGIRIYDVNSPFRLMRMNKLRNIISTIPDDTFAPNVIISGMVSLRRLRVLETEVVHHNREAGSGSLNKMKLIKSSMRSFWQTIVFRFSNLG